MKTSMFINPRTTRLLAVGYAALAATLAAQAASLNGRLIARPVTPGNAETYSLPANLEYSGGLTNVGVGTPVFLEADVSLGITGITNVAFTITSKPIGSAAVIAPSPLPTNMGIYEPADQSVYEVAGRALLRPDVTGQYTVSAAIQTMTNGSTNVTFNVIAATYMGAFVCELCHSGGIAESEYPYWTNTLHSMIFTEGIDGQLGANYSVSCLKCHTVGYDTNASSYADNGFYATQLADSWTFPTNLAFTNLAISNFANMPPSLQNLGNIQCENCHGPGSAHAYAFGNTNLPGWPLLTVTVSSGDCNQCHDDPTHHVYGTEWYASSHAVTTTIPTGSGRDQCVMCHTSIGFITRLENTQSNLVAGGTITNFPATNTIYAAIGCQTCHEPHGNTFPTNNAPNTHILRTLASVTLGDGTVVTNAGEAELCMECHHSRNGGASNNVVNYQLGLATWAGGSSFGPHDGPQGDLVEGANAITYGLAIPSSAHRLTVSNVCVGCHMQAVATTDPGFLKVGAHTFELKYNVTNSGVVTEVDQVAVCNQCHGGITNFNFPVEDYANTGTIQGVQTEVQTLLNQLSTLLPNSSGVVDGTVKTSLSTKTNWTQAQLQAAYNFQYVVSDGSLGVHNAPYATGILKASIANLSGVSVPGGLPDAWENLWFGSITNAAGAPNADPAGDGIPNWLKYSLGLNPLVKGSLATNGVIFGDVSVLGGATNTVQIYTAAEVAFNTQAGTNYWVQGVSSLSGGWQNVSPMLTGNGLPYSYLTPTRNDVQQYFRVVHNP